MSAVESHINSAVNMRVLIIALLLLPACTSFSITIFQPKLTTLNPSKEDQLIALNQAASAASKNSSNILVVPELYLSGTCTLYRSDRSCLFNISIQKFQFHSQGTISVHEIRQRLLVEFHLLGYKGSPKKTIFQFYSRTQSLTKSAILFMIALLSYIGMEIYCLNIVRLI